MDSGMTARERFLSVMNFEKSTRSMLWEFGYWEDTMGRWYEEGLPRKQKEKCSIQTDSYKKSMFSDNSICGEGLSWSETKKVPKDIDVHNYFNFDKGIISIPVNSWICPSFEKKILRDEGENVIIIDEKGIKKRTRKDGNSMPQYLAWPVENRNDWERLKEERFQLEIEKRLPPDWVKIVKGYREQGHILCCGYSISFFGSLRNLFGEVGQFLTYYDDPALIKDILNYLCDFWIDLWSHVFMHVIPDFVLIGEDLAYKNGPLISPSMFQEFMLPYYKRITSFLKKSGIRIIIVDTDGNFSKLIPLFLEGGVTGFYPFEAQAGMDIVKIRQNYPNIQILGGLDKTRIAKGKEEIDRELNAKLPFMLQQGGYIPYADHLIPPDISWENFKYYREKVEEFVRNN